MTERCQSCFYLSADGKFCDYYGCTGRLRTRRLPGGSVYCEPPERCSLYKPRNLSEKQRPILLGKAPVRERERVRQRDAAMLQLYQAGKNDREIAAELSCGKTTVLTWRKKVGLISQKEAGKKETPPPGTALPGDGKTSRNG